MTINISRNILNLTGQRGQRVNEIKLDEEGDRIVIHRSRDARRSTIDPTTGKKGTINQPVRRQVNDIPLSGYPCVLDIELPRGLSARVSAALRGVILSIKGAVSPTGFAD